MKDCAWNGSLGVNKAGTEDWRAWDDKCGWRSLFEARRFLSEYICLGSSPSFSATSSWYQGADVAPSLYDNLSGNYINSILSSSIRSAFLFFGVDQECMTDIAIMKARPAHEMHTSRQPISAYLIQAYAPPPISYDVALWDWWHGGDQSIFCTLYKGVRIW